MNTGHAWQFTPTWMGESPWAIHESADSIPRLEWPSAGLTGLGLYFKRFMDTLMERVRLASFADLDARKRAGLLRGLMFLHMKDGLDADPIRPRFSQESYQLTREMLSPSGVRKDFQEAFAELRTDLDAFTPVESNGLMACGYQMASWSFDSNLASLRELWEQPVAEHWPFNKILSEITSAAASTTNRERLLKELREGCKARG